MCQKASGQPFMGLTGGKPEHLRWTCGTLSVFKSSNMAERGFCRDCGTPLTYMFEGTGNISVTINSLDDPEAAPPTRQYGIESKVSWVDGIHALPALTSDAWLKQKAGQLISNQHAGQARLICWPRPVHRPRIDQDEGKQRRWNRCKCRAPHG